MTRFKIAIIIGLLVKWIKYFKQNIFCHFVNLWYYYVIKKCKRQITSLCKRCDNNNFKNNWHMCKKLIICMGNSYKNGGRCLAGIEVKKSSGGYNIVKNESGSPKWIRPVMKNDHNGIPESMVKAFGMLDVLEVDIANEVYVDSSWAWLWY